MNVGYEWHITRAQTTSKPADVPISAQEWGALVDSDPEMRRIDALEAVNPVTAEKIRIQGAGMAAWFGHAGFPDGVVFAYDDGEVSVKAHPDPRIKAKVQVLAEKLKAHVRGDEGENPFAERR